MVAKARKKWVTPVVTMQLRYHKSQDHASCIRYGLTISRKVGKAVQRNRARRRLRAIAEEVLSAPHIIPCDVVLIASPQTVSAKFSEILLHVTYAIKRLGAFGHTKRFYV